MRELEKKAKKASEIIVFSVFILNMYIKETEALFYEC